MKEEYEMKLEKINQTKSEFLKNLEIEKLGYKETHEANIELLKRKFQREYSFLEDECLMLQEELEKLKIGNRIINEEIAELSDYREKVAIKNDKNTVYAEYLKENRAANGPVKIILNKSDFATENTANLNFENLEIVNEIANLETEFNNLKSNFQNKQIQRQEAQSNNRYQRQSENAPQVNIFTSPEDDDNQEENIENVI
jgi:hypothetical protein